MARRRGRGEGSIWRRGDGRWEGRADLGWADGKRQRRAVYGRSRAEVATKLGVLLHAHQEGLLSSSPAQRLGDFMEGWLRSIEGSVRPKTLQTIRMYVRRHIVPDLGKSRLDKLQPERVQALLDKVGVRTGAPDGDPHPRHPQAGSGSRGPIRMDSSKRSSADRSTASRTLRDQALHARRGPRIPRCCARG